MSVQRPFTREQRTTIVNGMLAFVLMLVVLQLWLLTATMNAYLGGDESVIWPAAVASLACLLLNAGLLRYLYRHRPHAPMSGARRDDAPGLFRPGDGDRHRLDRLPPARAAVRSRSRCSGPTSSSSSSSGR